ncbi:MAG TPA: type II toxin-antitoxin system VapC family toxin [Acidimicrobiales bacterium]|nr:type II toxin-antitoxin system VapC family toxin [Acidimicrobiales bacterium]
MIVVDASVLANALADDGADGRVARARLTTGDELAAPDLVDVETIAVLRKRWLAGDLPARRFSDAIDDLEDLQLTRYPALALVHRAFELRDNVTPYDAVYVALAERLGCTLVTADQRLAAAPGLGCSVDVLQV